MIALLRRMRRLLWIAGVAPAMIYADPGEFGSAAHANAIARHPTLQG
jgi:hypothetical protein